MLKGKKQFQEPFAQIKNIITHNTSLLVATLQLMLEDNYKNGVEDDPVLLAFEQEALTLYKRSIAPILSYDINKLYSDYYIFTKKREVYIDVVAKYMATAHKEESEESTDAETRTG